MIRFPDSRINAAFHVFPGWNPVTAVRTEDSNQGPGTGEAPLPVYSGGTVWAFHPLRVAAGVSRRIVSADPVRPDTTREV